MAQIKADRVAQPTTVEGTIGVVPAGAIRTFRPFSAVMASGDTTDILILHATMNEYEICESSWNGTTLSRGTLRSSTTGARMNFSPGAKTVSIVSDAFLAILLDAAGDLRTPRDIVAGRYVIAPNTYGFSSVMSGGAARPVLSVGADDYVNAYVAGGAGKKWRVLNQAGDAELFGVDNSGNVNIGAAASVAAALTVTNIITALHPFGGLAFLEAVGGAGGRFTLNNNGTISLQMTANGFAAAITPLVFSAAGVMLPGADNTYPFGSGSFRWSVLYAATGTINTSGEADKLFIGEAIDAEKRAATTIKAQVRRFKFADAVETKGEQAARWHFGYTAEIVRDALEAEGLDPGNYGFFCADPIIVVEKYFETAQRPRTRKVTDVAQVVEVKDGRPVMVTKDVERDEPVGAFLAVIDEKGEAVMRPIGEAAGEQLMSPLTHFVPEMEDYQQELTREVDTGKVRLGLRYSELEAFLRSAE